MDIANIVFGPPYMNVENVIVPPFNTHHNSLAKAGSATCSAPPSGGAASSEGTSREVMYPISTPYALSLSLT